jgi:hypothetical protein
MIATDTSALIVGVDSRIVVVIVAFISFLVSVVSLVIAGQAKKLSERETAKSVYRRYLEPGFQNPKYVTQDSETGYVEYGKFTGDEATSYRMFVTIVLHACEKILDRSNDRNWRNAISRQLKQHKPYFAQMNQTRCHQYDKRLRDVVRPLAGGNW